MNAKNVLLVYAKELRDTLRDRRTVIWSIVFPTLVIPLLMVPLLLTLVGIPIAVILLVVWLVGILLGPIPAVTRLGVVLMRSRGGLAGALVVGAVVWRAAMWLLPLIAALLYLVALLVGLGAYVSAGWKMRRASAVAQPA